jgi:hypothetical protein
MPKGRTILKICYIINAVLIGLFISSFAGFTLGYFLGYATIGWPIFIIFQILNAWAIRAYKNRRTLFISISIILGIHNAFFIVWSVMWWLDGATMP